MTAVIVRAGAAAGAASQHGLDAAAGTAQVSLCVEVLPMQQSIELGQATQWAVSAWTTGGNVPDATIKLQAAPAGGGTPHFSFGCGSDDGTSSCNLGAVDAGSAQRQFQAQFTVPLTATVSSVSLTATGSAANLHADPVASASVTVLAPPSPIGVSASVPDLPPIGVSAPTSTLSPGGNASSLFPALSPSAPPTGGAATTGGAALGGARQVANTSSAYTGAASSTGAEVAGLAALALAFILAVTRVSIRRPAPAAAGAATPLPEAPAGSAGQPGQPGQPEDPPAVPPDAGADDA